MSRCVDEIELDSLPLHAHGSELYRDAALALEVHIIERLRLEFALLEGTSDLHESVCESRLPVVDMSDDTKIADRGRCRHARTIVKKLYKTSKNLFK